jgi:hypothetical protein
MHAKMPVSRERPATLRARRWRSGFTVSLFVLVILGCSGSGIREDELACESAVAYLQQCCDGYSGANIDCTYQGETGCSPAVYPEITVSQSACFRGESCEELQTTGLCTRVAAVPMGTAPVCP